MSENRRNGARKDLKQKNVVWKKQNARGLKIKAFSIR